MTEKSFEGTARMYGTEKEMYDEVSLAVEVSGNKDEVEALAKKSLEEKVSSEVTSRAKGAKHEKLHTEFVVNIAPKLQTGKSNESYQKALEAATAGGIEYNALQLIVSETYKVPFDYVEAKATARSKQELLEALKSEETALRTKHGSLMYVSPQKVLYSVGHYSGAWAKKQQSPKGNVVGKAQSNTTLEEAENKAKEALGKNKAKSVLYEGTHVFKFGGAKDPAAKEDAQTYRAGGTSAYTPSYAAKESSLI